MGRTIGLIAAVVLVGSVATARAVPFEDMIDYWGPCGADSVMITECSPLYYCHDVNPQIDFDAGCLVTEAWLELDFTNDWTDFNMCLLDFTEDVTVGLDGDEWINLGEVDNGQYTVVVDVEYLNLDGVLGVALKVSSSGLNPATAWLDHSRLYGEFECPDPNPNPNPQPAPRPEPVPEPATMSLAGLGLAALLLRRRRRAA